MVRVDDAAAASSEVVGLVRQAHSRVVPTRPSSVATPAASLQTPGKHAEFMTALS